MTRSHEPQRSAEGSDSPPPPEAETLSSEEITEQLEGPRAIRQIDRARRSLDEAARMSADCEITSGDATTRLPEQIGRFEIVREIGRGGSGVVFQARDPKLERDVAVKVPRPEALLTGNMRKRFELEARAAALLSHPGIVPVFEVSFDDPVSYIAAEYCDADSLARWIKRQPAAISERLAAELLAQLADAVAHAHARGVLHRDLKPGNILMLPEAAASGPPPTWNPPQDQPPDAATAAGSLPQQPPAWRARITDFGLAKLTTADASKSQSGGVLGTPSYMAPEQTDPGSGDPDPRTDVYGLGAILYELLTRRPPFREASDMATLIAVREQLPADPCRLRLGLSPDLAAITSKCLEKRAEDRYATVRDLAADLRRFLAGEPTLARPLGMVRRSLKWIRLNQVATALFAVVMLSATALTVGALFHANRLATELEEKELLRQDAERRRSEMQRQRYLGDIRLISTMFDQGSFEDALRRLQRYGPQAPAAAERDFGWDYLWAKYNRQVKVFAGHEGDVSCFALLSAEKQLITGGHDGTVRVFDMKTQQQVARLDEFGGQVNTLALTPDAQTLLVGADAGELSVWDLRPLAERAAPRMITKLSGHTDDVLCLAVSPNSKYFVSAGVDQQMLVWDLATFEIVRPLEFHTDWVRDLEFLPDGNRFLSISHDRRTALWDAGRGERLDVFQNAQRMGLTLSINPVHGLLASGGDRRLVWLRPLAALTKGNNQPDGEREPLQNDAAVLDDRPAVDDVWLADFDGWVRSVDFSADGEFLVAAGNDPIIRVYRRDDNGKYRIFRNMLGHRRCTWAAEFIDDTRRIISAGEDGTARITSALGSRRAEIASREFRSAENATSLSATRDGDQAVYLDDSRLVRLRLGDQTVAEPAWDPPAGGTLKRVVISPDGTWLALTRINANQEEFVLLDGDTMQEVASVAGDFPEKHSIVFHPDNKWIATSGVGGSLHIRTIPDLKVIYEYSLPVEGEHIDINVPDILVTPDGHTLTACVTHGPNKLLVWDGTKEFGEPICIPEITHLLAVSPKSKYLAIVSADNKIHIWQIATQQIMLTLEGHADETVSGSFSLDGRYLATSAETGPIKIWALDAAELALDIVEDLAVPYVAFVGGEQLLVTHSFVDEDGVKKVGIRSFP